MAKRHAYLLAICVIVGAGSAWGASLTPALINGLRQGGYVLVMRHASSPSNPPDKSTADPENTGLERQLDKKGRTTAEAMGRAFKSLSIPVGQIFSSPTYRARETIRLAALGVPINVPQLGDQGHSMARLKGPDPSAWLKAEVAESPPRGKNTIIVTHMPNIVAAFPDQANDLQDGETLLFRPDGKGHSALVAKIPIDDWKASAR